MVTSKGRSTFSSVDHINCSLSSSSLSVSSGSFSTMFRGFVVRTSRQVVGTHQWWSALLRPSAVPVCVNQRPPPLSAQRTIIAPSRCLSSAGAGSGATGESKEDGKGGSASASEHADATEMAESELMSIAAIEAKLGEKKLPLFCMVGTRI